MIYDITRTVTPSTAVWPGDTSFTYAYNLSMAEGASVNLTTLTISPHTGTHADAYYHYTSDGAHPAGMSLVPYIGPARVVSVTKRDGPLTPDDLSAAAGAERVLVHSHVSELEDTVFAQEYPYLSMELIEWLARQGTRLIGLDSPSVDSFDSKTLPCHNALRAHNMVNLELVCLRGIPDGDYELIALPLRIDEICGSPVRAILRMLPSP